MKGVHIDFGSQIVEYLQQNNCRLDARQIVILNHELNESLDLDPITRKLGFDLLDGSFGTVDQLLHLLAPKERFGA